MCLWEALSGEAIGIPLRGHGDHVTCIAISRDGKLVMSGSREGTVQLWDVSAERNGSENHRLVRSRYEDGVDHVQRSTVSLSVCANGQIAVSGSEDGTLQRWDVLTGEVVGESMLGHGSEGWQNPVAISRDGTLIVSGGGDCMVRRWNASTGEAIGEPMDGHSGEVTAIVISDDGKHIFTGSDHGTVRRWDARTGEEVGKSMKHSGGHEYGIDDLVISIDGKLIVSGAYRSLERWDARTGERVGDYIKVPGWARNIIISNDGETIAWGSKFYGYVQKWETKSGKPVGEPMKWSEGEHMLEEMERARLCGDQDCDAVVRKDTYPLEMTCRAVCPDKNKIVLGLRNGNVAVCERH